MYHCPVELRASNEPPGTDHTGEIISFSAVGSGGGAPPYDPPRPWGCYLEGVAASARWQFPDGTTVGIGTPPAAGDQLITTVVSGALALSRGSIHNSPDGEHCCVGTTDTTQRLCVTFSEY